MIPRERITYSAIVDRPPLLLPDSARVAVWTIVNLEEWDIARPMARQVLPAPGGVSPVPDIPNWAWHEYGMRVGFWRLKAALDRFGITPTLSINAAVCQSYPRVAEAARDGQWEFMGHSLVQMPIHQLENQRDVIRQSLDTLQCFTGRRPRGWLGPGLTQTFETVDYLAAEGVQYIGDWVLDDQPCEIRTAHGPLYTLPYTLELNDISMMVVQHHPSELFLRRVTDQFDRLYAEGKESARIMAIAVHPYLSGVPHRIKYFEEAYEYLARQTGVVFWTGEQILDWYLSARPTAR
ncbi:MAG TPA: polysaccharide deacetylase family protein [Candidatus Baltobacteraceae bacterium]|nr:polysaccharide deacetylase family protein [Candidatus Baltobacteraceae bacterium]